jgi:hypothetical protein
MCEAYNDFYEYENGSYFSSQETKSARMYLSEDWQWAMLKIPIIMGIFHFKIKILKSKCPYLYNTFPKELWTSKCVISM